MYGTGRGRGEKVFVSDVDALAVTIFYITQSFVASNPLGHHITQETSLRSLSLPSTEMYVKMKVYFTSIFFLSVFWLMMDSDMENF